MSFWIEYCEPFHFGANPDFGEVKGENDPSKHKKPIAFGSRKDKYSPFTDGKHIYFLLEDRQTVYVPQIVWDTTGKVTNERALESALKPFVQD